MLFYIWAGATVYLVLHYLYFHLRLLFLKRSGGQFSQPVSIIICAHNEHDNLCKNLPSVLSQQYDTYEVVVVNDHSTDGSAALLEELSKEYPNLKVLNFTKTKVARGKKEALLFGIENARYAHLLFTDADCQPAGTQWLKSMAAPFDTKEIVLGISPYYFQNNLVGWVTAWETFSTAQQYISFARAGRPYMGVGRNLAYTKAVFNQSSKMRHHLELPSGDDDLLIGEVANSRNVALNIDKGSFTYSPAPAGLRAWWRQKRRHLSTSYRYKKATAMLLALFGISQMLFYILLIPAGVIGGGGVWFVALLGIKLALQIVTIAGFAAKIGQTKTLGFFIIIEPLVVFLLALIHFQNKMLGNSKDW